MRTLTYYVAASLDGFIAGPDGEFAGDYAPWTLRRHDVTAFDTGVTVERYGV